MPTNRYRLDSLGAGAQPKKIASALERQEDEPVSGSDSSDTPVKYPDDPSPIK